jgi:hypothetical protein
MPGSFRVSALVQLDGWVREDVLASALQNLQFRHPKLRSRIVDGRDGLRFHFETASPPIPVWVTDSEDAHTQWRDTARRMQVHFPDAGPLAAVTVLRSPLRLESIVSVSLHHSIADGLSALMLVEDLLTEYARVESNPIALPRPGLRAVTAARARFSGGWRDRFWLVRRLLRLQREESRSPQTKLPESGAKSPQSQWAHWVLSRAETLALVRRCRNEHVSFGSALVASAICGLMECLATSEAVFKCTFPFDIRDSLQSPQGQVTTQDLGCFASVMNDVFRVGGQPSFWDLARQAHQSQQEFVRRGGPSFYYNLAAGAAFLDKLRTAARRFVRPAPQSKSSGDPRVTLLATYYGLVTLQQQYGSLRPRACTLVFGNVDAGPSIIMEALVLGQQLNIGLAAGSLDAMFWDRFHQAVRRQLDSAVGSSPAAARQAGAGQP